MPEIGNSAASLSKGTGGETSEQALDGARVPLTEEEMRAIHVGELTPLVVEEILARAREDHQD